MSYDLLVLDQAWFAAPEYSGKYNVLSAIINKAYSKPMARYGVFKSTRIKHPDTFMASLQLDGGKGFFYAIVLGTKEKFEQLRSEHGYQRKFNANIQPLSSANESDIPDHLAQHFGPVTFDNMNVRFVDRDERLDPEIMDRVIASIGFKSCDAEFGSQDGVAHYEVAAFTSFKRRAGTELFQLATDEFFVKKSVSLVKSVPQYILHAVVVKDHDLVAYYTKVLGFTNSDAPDLVVPVSGEGSPLEDDIVATRDFTLSFLEREVLV